ncbi:MAG: metal-dependent transcriptional regulator [Thermoflexales bacterium]|nr:metal-dependent transcriptional regulator [Thermoflexales bacterium]
MRNEDTATERRHHVATAGATDFLTETHLEGQEHGRVALRALAGRLSVSPPAVSRMAQRMARRGLVKREGACGLALTEQGLRIAMRALRKRRIFEVFLVRQLGYGWHEVYPVAAPVSNTLDDELVERMYQRLGHPARCPHGDPIPGLDGSIAQPPSRALSELGEGERGVIGRIGSHDSEMLRYLNSIGIRPGVPLMVVARAPFSGPLRARLGEGDHAYDQALGVELASRVWVEPASAFA